MSASPTVHPRHIGPQEISLRPFERTSDDRGNVSMQYGEPIWSADHPTCEELQLALSLLYDLSNTALFLDDKPLTFVTEAR